jgi:hypothetical protein
MKDYFRQSMAWLHTWVGLLLGWVLYFMFIRRIFHQTAGAIRIHLFVFI